MCRKRSNKYGQSGKIQSANFWFEMKIERDQYKMARFFHHFPPINPLNLPLTECILKVLRSFCSTSSMGRGNLSAFHKYSS